MGRDFSRYATALARNAMSPRILFFACLIVTGSLIAETQAQSPAPADKTTAVAPTSETKQQIKARKKAERIAIRKKRAQCYDEAQKEKMTGQNLVRFLETCNKK
jgi:hypothetical protein